MKKMVLVFWVFLILFAGQTCFSSDLINLQKAGTSQNVFSIFADGGIQSSATITSGAGLINVTESWTTPPAESSMTWKSVYIATATLVGAGTTWVDTLGNFTQVTSTGARSIEAAFHYGMGTGTTTVVGLLTIDGTTSRGNLIKETVVMSTIAAQSNYAYIRIATLTVVMTYTTEKSQLSCYVNIGQGTRFGLSNSINAASDIYKIIEGPGDIKNDNAGLNINTVYDTIDFVTNPGGAYSYEVRYRAITR